MLLWWLSIECFSVASTFVGSRLPRRRSGHSTGTVVPTRLVVEPGHLVGVVGDIPRKLGAEQLEELQVVRPDKPAVVSA